MSVKPGDLQSIRSEEEFNSHVRQKIEDKSFQEWIIGAKRGEKVYELMNKLYSDLSEKLILDIGCGYGGISLVLSKKASEVFSLDLNRGFLDVANVRTKISGGNNLLLVRGSAPNLPIRNSALDIILINGVLEWIPYSKPGEDPESTQMDALKESQRILKDNGTLFLAIENRYYLRYWLGAVDHHSQLRFVPVLPRKIADFISLRKKGEPYLSRTHSYSRLKNMSQEAGLKMIRVYVGIPDYVFPEEIADIEDKASISRQINSVRQKRSRRIIWQIINKMGLMKLFSSNFILVCQKTLKNEYDKELGEHKN